MIYTRKINYYETDGMKIVHHSNYIRFLEEARIYYMDNINLPYSKMEEEGIMIPVLEVSCKYKHPCKFNDEIEVEVKIKEYTSVKLIIEYKIKNKTTNLLASIAETKHCFTDESMKPISLKKIKPNMHEIIKKSFEANL